MKPDNREHWPTLSRGDITDRLVVMGVPEDKARRLDKYAAVRMLRHLDARNELLTNCTAEALVEDMIRHGVEIVKAGGAWKLKTNGVAGERWVEGILPTLKFRRDEIVDAWFARPANGYEFRTCPKCLAAVYDPEYRGEGCEFILSCPMGGGS